jgi:glutamine synthetase
MAKWDYGLAGNSCHIHTSLLGADGEAVFAAGKGYSDIFKHYLAGQLALASDITYFLAPCINSYKRFQAGSFAPTKAIWSTDNRTAGFRVVGHGPALRVACRVPGADANPYLACAALLAAGLHGISNRLELEPAFTGDAYKGKDIQEVPKTLREALDFLGRSEALRAAFGDAVVEHYLHAGRWEQLEYDRRVTDHELIRGFERA